MTIEYIYLIDPKSLIKCANFDREGSQNCAFRNWWSGQKCGRGVRAAPIIPS
jgi:hypothetical protein